MYNKPQAASPLKTFLAFAAIYLIWGSTYLALKQALDSIPPFLLMGTRSVVAGTILYLWGRYRTGERVKRDQWPSLVIIGIAFFLIGHGGLAWGQNRVPSGVAALLIAPEPIWIAGVESIMIKGFRIGRGGILGLILGLVAIVFLIDPMEILGNETIDILGAVVIVIAGLSWSSGAVYLKTAHLPRTPAITAGLELVIGGSLLLVVSSVLGETVAKEISVRSLLSLGYLIVFGSIIAFSAYVWLLKTTAATRVATHTYVNPVIAIILGWAIGGEEITLNIIVAGFVIVVSVYLVLKDQMMKPGEDWIS